jgi:excisionase family DNA binding protein
VTSEPTLYTPAEVGGLLGVNAKTVSRWCVEGRLPALRTLGGHRRIPSDGLLTLLRRMGVQDDDAKAMLRSVVE